MHPALRRPSCRSRADEAHAFAASRLGAAAPAALAVHDRLVAAAVETPGGRPRRLPSISLDGTPLVYSCAAGAGTPLRLLVDPGGLGLDVPAQLRHALALGERLLADAGWGAAAAGVRALAEAAAPDGVSASLRGGAWLGLVAGPGGLAQLRTYLDLRAGSEPERWQRVADALAPLARAGDEPAFGALVERVAGRAAPVGLGAAVARGRLRVVRLYAAIPHPDEAALAALVPDARPLAALLADRLGPFPREGITVGYDLHVAGGALVPPGSRTKIDVCCLGHADAARRVWRLARDLRADADELDGFLADLDRCFGGSLVQYASVGLSSGRPPRLTVYAQPAARA